MSSQLPLPVQFDMEQKTQESYWDLSRKGVLEAAAILVDVVRTQPLSVVAFVDIVKVKMGLAGDTIPVPLARAFADQVDAVNTARLRIKEMAEETSDIQFRIVDAQNRPAIRGGAPSGFTTLFSEVGLEDEQAQTVMTVAKMRALLRRREQLGVINASEAAQGFELLRGTSAILASEASPQAALPGLSLTE